jgi:hypothetical protein
VALLVAADHSLASLHHALTAHETCAEHGEQVHASATPARGDFSSAVAGIESGTETEEEHHHCGAVPAAPLRAPIASDRSEPAVPSFGACASHSPSVVAFSAADVLAFAPKQSPPRV